MHTHPSAGVEYDGNKVRIQKYSTTHCRDNVQMSWEFNTNECVEVDLHDKPLFNAYLGLGSSFIFNGEAFDDEA